MADAIHRSRFFWFVLFLAGFVYGLFGSFAALYFNTGDPQRAAELLAQRFSIYVYIMIAGGVAWVLIGKGLTRFPPPSSWGDWIKYVLIVLLILPPISLFINLTIRAVFAGGDFSLLGLLFTGKYWSDLLFTPPANFIALVRSILLVSLARIEWNDSSSQAFGRSSWSPGTIPSFKPDQVTRLLCGSAFLNSTIPTTVSNFLRDKHTAVAPEYGIDVRLLTTVCSFIDRRMNRFSYAFAGIALVGLILFSNTSPESLAPEAVVAAAIIASILLWIWKSFGDRSFARSFERGFFTRERIAERFAGGIDDKLAGALPSEGQNLIVYKGFLPFVGSGFDLDGWSFVTFIDKPALNGSKDRIKPFSEDELNVALDIAMKVSIPDVECKNVFFVRGIDVRDDGYILPDLAKPPRQQLAPEIAKGYSDQNGLARRYKRIQIYDWGGEIVVTYFLRCAVRGNSLFVELRRFLLPPIAAQYRTVDSLGEDTFSSFLGSVLVAIFVGPIYAVLSCFIVFGKLQEGMSNIFGAEERKIARRRRELQHNPSFDWGAESSLRVLFSQSTFAHYFQKTDSDSRNKLIERKILDEIERFLDDHGIDTTDIRDRQTTILNSGILVQGGDVRAESLAVGAGAQSTKIENQRAGTSKGTPQ